MKDYSNLDSTDLFIKDLQGLQFSKDLFKQLDLLIDEKSLCVKTYTGTFEERVEEKVFNENISLYSGPWREEDSAQWRFMEPIEEKEEEEEGNGEWVIYWKKLDKEVNKLLIKAGKLSRYGIRKANDESGKDDGIIILGNKFKSIRI
jgi:hypothetical protein